MSTSLPPTVVGIDVETTALDPTNGEIIEIAAIRYETKSGKEVDRFHRLCKPSEPISDEITRITSITNEMVEDKPSYADIKDDLDSFLGDDPLFAHNAPFDVKWISAFGPDIHSRPVWDTFPLATIAWPEATSYNLGSLARMLAIPALNEHRADADVEMTWQVLQAARSQLTVNPDTHSMIASVLDSSKLSHYLLLFSGSKHEKSTPSAQEQYSLSETQEVSELLTALEQPGTSTWAHRLHGPEAQSHVLAALISGQKRTTVLATDTGWRLSRLADEIVPAQQREHSIDDVQIATVRHPAAYICGKRLADATAQSFAPADALQLVRLLVWIDQGGTGEIDRLNLTHQSITPLLASVSADSPKCQGIRCSILSCPRRKALETASSASVVLTTHRGLLHLLDSEDTSASACVIEHAHVLDESVREGGRRVVAPFRLSALVRDLALEIDDEGVTRKLDELIHSYELVAQAAATVSDTAAPIEITLEGLPQVKRAALQKQAAEWVEQAKLALGFVAGAIAQNTVATDLLTRVEQFVTDASSFYDAASGRIQWIATASTPDSPFLLNDVPRDVSQQLATMLQSYASTVLCSPLLRTPRLSDALQRRILDHAPPATHITSSNPKGSSAKLLITSDTPHPNDAGFVPQVAQLTHAIASQFSGGVAVLATSKSGIQELHSELYTSLNKGAYKIVSQGVTGSAAQVTRVFSNDPAHVVLLRDWDGRYTTNLQGVKCIVVPKLPFPRPHDPVVEALSAHNGVSSFAGYSLPSVIQNLVLGVGHIRPPRDSGILVVLLDSRLTTSGYGSDIQESLGPSRITTVTSAQLPDEVTSWIRK